MKQATAHDDRIGKMKFVDIYPLYLDKVLKKGRTHEELVAVLEWLTGRNVAFLQKCLDDQVTFSEIYQLSDASTMCEGITGVVCGVRVEEISNGVTRMVRSMDKLVDELAKGKNLSDIVLRS